MTTPVTTSPTEPRHPSAGRLVAVTDGDLQVRGSGYLLTSRWILTAGHVVTGVPDGELRVCRLSPWGNTAVKVVSVENDVAFLLAAEDLAEPGEPAVVRMAELAADTRFEDCSAIGLPAVMTRPRRGVAPLQPSFRVAPNSADRHGYLSLEVVGHPPEGPDPWSGMSGAPVFHAGRWLVGVIVRDSAGWDHSRLEAAPVGAFPDTSATAGAALRVSHPLTEGAARDAAFLDVYRKDVVRRYGHIELFGLGRHGHLDDDIGIEHAYVSLHAGLPALGRPGVDQSRPVEQLLPGNPRLLLRGDAGAGKSTLLEWLAVAMARGTCTGPLAAFNERVPFLIRLRDMYAPRWKQTEGREGVLPEPEEFLRFSRTATGTTPPDGWLRRMLEDRALLLVDGLDEVLESHRDGVLEWINELLRDFRALPVVVTGRPEAMLRWSPPRKLGFAELRLLELNKDQRTELIHKWHRAAALGVTSSRLDDDERERRVTRLTELEAALVKRIDESQDLAALAATPLLCAVLCKLHEVYGSNLPRLRRELYEKTVEMMLGMRDMDRRVPDPLPHLDVDQRRAILSWVAGYLTTEGEREITVTRFEEKVRERQRSLGPDASTHTPEEIRRALQHRSGLLVAPGEDTLRFSHRTFQDYLAAIDLVAQRAFGQLAGHAGDETWDDILRFAMSRCGPADTHEFVTQFRKKLRLMPRSPRRRRMQLAAASCIPYAVQMSEEDRRALVAGVAKRFRSMLSLFAPTVEQFAAVGPDLLTALRRDADWSNLEHAAAYIALAAAIGGPEALRFLSDIPERRRRQFSASLAAGWSSFPGAEYAERVLHGLPLAHLTVSRQAELQLARGIGPVTRLSVYTSIPVDDIADFAREHDVTLLEVVALRYGTSLAPLADVSTLRVLNVCVPLQSVRALCDDPQTFRRSFWWPYAPMPFALPALPQLSELSLGAVPTDWTEQAPGWHGLTHLGLVGPAQEALTGIGALPALTHLLLSPDPGIRWSGTPIHTGVTHLVLILGDFPGRTALSQLLAAFPSLNQLDLHLLARGDATVDLTGLERVPQLRVRISGLGHGGSRVTCRSETAEGQITTVSEFEDYRPEAAS